MEPVTALFVVVDVAGGHHIQAGRVRSLHQRAIAISISTDGVSLQLHDESVWPKSGAASFCETPRSRQPLLCEARCQHTGATAGQNDQPFLALLEGVEVESWVESILPPQVGFGNEPAEVGVAGGVFG